MPAPQPTTYAAIDWDQLWRNTRQQNNRQHKDAADWDRRSVSFAARNTDSPFAPLVIEHLPSLAGMSVLDVGCGPGTLAIPLAAHAASVCAIDFSPAMLEILTARAAAADLHNINTRQCAWEDDWQRQGLTRYDLVIASRSMAVDDLRQALQKVNAHTRNYAVIIDRIAPTPYDPAVFAAVGRPFAPGADYIFTINMLYTMGIHAQVQILTLPGHTHFASLQEAVDSHAWQLKDLSDGEELRLRRYLQEVSQPAADGGLVIPRSVPPCWAMIWWQQNQPLTMTPLKTPGRTDTASTNTTNNYAAV